MVFNPLRGSHRTRRGGRAGAARRAGTMLGLLLALAAIPVQAQAPSGSENYHMGPGDRIDINVYDTPELSLTTRINENGSIDYPLLGEIHLAGLTESEAANKIGKQLVDQNILKEPSVTVTVKSFKSRRVTIIGEVAQPGEYYLSDQRSVVDLLGKAGWIKPDGADYIRLTRQKGQDGKKVLDISMDELTGGKYKDLMAQAGDVIYVPKEQVFYIQGAVQKPGSYRFKGGMTVMEALSIGGGLTPRGSRSRIELKRRDDSGDVQTYDAELDDKLKPGDTLYVKERLF